jgi:hypothetical protein
MLSLQQLSEAVCSNIQQPPAASGIIYPETSSSLWQHISSSLQQYPAASSSLKRPPEISSSLRFQQLLATSGGLQQHPAASSSLKRPPAISSSLRLQQLLATSGGLQQHPEASSNLQTQSVVLTNHAVQCLHKVLRQRRPMIAGVAGRGGTWRGGAGRGGAWRGGDAVRSISSRSRLLFPSSFRSQSRGGQGTPPKRKRKAK